MSLTIAQMQHRVTGGETLTVEDCQYLLAVLDDVAYYGSGMSCNLCESPAYRAKGDMLYDLAVGLKTPSRYEEAATTSGESPS